LADFVGQTTGSAVHSVVLPLHHPYGNLKTKIADAVLSVGPRPEGPLPTSTSETPAAATIRLGDIAATPGDVTRSGRDVNGRFSVVTHAERGRGVHGVATTFHNQSLWQLDVGTWDKIKAAK